MKHSLFLQLFFSLSFIRFSSETGTRGGGGGGGEGGRRTEEKKEEDENIVSNDGVPANHWVKFTVSNYQRKHTESIIEAEK